MAGRRVLVIDNAHRTAASLSAAGIVSPITGKRLNRPLLIDQLLADAFSIYPSIEQFLGASFFRHRKVLRLLQSAEEQQHWKERVSTGDYSKYLGSLNYPRFASDEPWFGGFGLGSKGALQAPFASKQLIDNLEKGRPIHPEFDVCRRSLWQQPQSA
jgi:hypothetical protein